jgi:carboxyl-terminal processing protease
MRGEPNTKVLLTIYRKDENRTFPVTITREEIKQQSVRGKLIEPGYAWIRISQFQERTVDDFAKKILELSKSTSYATDGSGARIKTADGHLQTSDTQALKGLVLDLRNDPGGLLNAAVAISAAFLPENVTVVSTNGQTAESKQVLKAAARDYMGREGSDALKSLPASLKKVPLIVLVNEGSASASEIVAGALQDHKRATIIGTRSFGKGSVQTIIPLGNEGAIRLTTQRYYTPSGRSIQAKGIDADIIIEQPLPPELQGKNVSTEGEAGLKGHLANPGGGDEGGGSSVFVPEDKTKDVQLKAAIDFLHGVKVVSNVKPTEKKDEKKQSN